MINLTAKMKQAASENPFYGKTNLLAFYQQAQSGQINSNMLSSAWNSCTTDLERELFWVIAFSVGDIANRQHNVLRGVKNLDQGGSSNRSAFHTVLNWMKNNYSSQYERFLVNDVIRQYTTLDNVLANRVKTRPGSKTIIGTVDFLDGVNLDSVADYIARLIQNKNEFDNQLIAKFLTNVRLSKRQKKNRLTGKLEGNRNLQELTKQLMQKRQMFYKTLSDKMGWEYVDKGSYIDFVGLRKWKQQYNSELESVLFSTGKILNMDNVQFINWLNSIPAGARYRVRRRLLDKNNLAKEKWANTQLPTWFLNWEASKSDAQQEYRDLQEKIRQSGGSDEEKAKLAKLAKESKVTTGGTTMFDILERMSKSLSNKQELNILANELLQRVKLEVPALVIADCSGSMGGLPTFIARLLATIAMLKNPSTELDDILFTFGSECQIYTDGSNAISKQNRFVSGKSTIVKKLIDRTQPFLDNFQSLSKIINSNMGGTNFSSVAQKIKEWVNSDPQTKQHKIEQLQGYPVFIVVSDGDMNSDSSAAESMMRFRRVMAEFGWDGVVVVWDVNTGHKMSSKFDNVPNTMHFFGWNAGIINQVFTKLHDLDIIDVYTPLLKIYESNRYDLVKRNVI